MVRKLSSSVDAVYAAWTEPRALAQWLTPGADTLTSVTMDVEEGGRFRLEGISGQKAAYVIDLSGKILQKIAIKGQQQVSICNLPVGTYVLSIPDAFGPGKHFKEKVMVVR